MKNILLKTKIVKYIMVEMKYDFDYLLFFIKTSLQINKIINIIIINGKINFQKYLFKFIFYLAFIKYHVESLTIVHVLKINKNIKTVH